MERATTWQSALSAPSIPERRIFIDEALFGSKFKAWVASRDGSGFGLGCLTSSAVMATSNHRAWSSIRSRFINLFEAFVAISDRQSDIRIPFTRLGTRSKNALSQREVTLPAALYRYLEPVFID